MRNFHAGHLNSIIYYSERIDSTGNTFSYKTSIQSLTQAVVQPLVTYFGLHLPLVIALVIRVAGLGIEALLFRVLRLS